MGAQRDTSHPRVIKYVRHTLVDRRIIRCTCRLQESYRSMSFFRPRVSREYFIKTKKINTRSSTEAELVAINDAMALVLWCRLFIMGQGFEIRDNIVYQDNQSTMLLGNNGRHSSGKKTRHIEICYYLLLIRLSERMFDLSIAQRKT